MRTPLLIATGLTVALAFPGPTPTLAACSDEIAALEKSLNNEGKQAIATSSGGQKDAGARGGKAQEAKKTGTPVEDLPHPDSGGSVKADQAAAATGSAGDSVMQAKVSLNDAKNAQKKGDEKACMDAVAKTKTQQKG